MQNEPDIADTMNETLQQSNSPQAALWTPRGRGAVATIRYWGDCQTFEARTPALFQAANGCLLSQQSVGDILFGHWGTEAKEEVVLCRLTDNQLAIHCHGGEAATKRILNDLAGCGTEVVLWSHGIGNCAGVFEAEMCEVLSHTQTVRAANIVLQQSDALRSAFEQLSESNRQQKWDDLNNQLHLLLQWSQFGLHLTTPWKVVIAGRPNVGKSSLINKLAGFERAIVFDQPGTTRDVVHVETVFAGWLFQLIDTAGIREEAISLEQQGIERSLETLQSADCQIIVLDQSQPLTKEDINFLEEHSSAIVVANKSDLPSAKWDEHDIPMENILSVSAISGEGIEPLCERIVKQLVPEVPSDHIPIPVTIRQIECLQRISFAVQKNDTTQCQSAIASLLE